MNIENLDRLIRMTRADRIFHRAHKNQIEASACAIREKALCEARAVVIGKVDPEFRFRPGV